MHAIRTKAEKIAVPQLRSMRVEDWPDVKRIYESGIETGVATFETTAPDCKSWNDSHLSFGRIVAVVKNKVAGWAALSPVSNRSIYSGIAEVSIYVDQSYRGNGIGKLLLQQLIIESEANGIWTLQAGIITDNAASVRLHEQSGFRIIGYREKSGKLNGIWKDNYLLEKRSQLVGID